MQHITSGTAPAYRQMSDFDFGVARRRPADTPRKRQRPGLVAGLVAFAFAVSMLIPVGARAEPVTPLFAAPYSSAKAPVTVPGPTLPGLTLPGLTLAEGKHWERRGTNAARKAPLPATCALQFDGQRSGFRGYSENCLRDRGLRDRLPRGCALNARIFGQRDRLFPADCLRDAGFVLRDR